MKKFLAVFALAVLGLASVGCTEKQEPQKAIHDTIAGVEMVIVDANAGLGYSKDTNTAPPTCRSHIYGESFPITCESVEQYFRNGNKIVE